MRYNFFNKISKIFIFVSILVLIEPNFYVNKNKGIAAGLNTSNFSFDFKNQPLRKVFDDIGEFTGYGIVIDKELEGSSVTISLIEVQLLEALRRILCYLNVSNYSLIIDEKNSIIEIYNVSGGNLKPLYSSESVLTTENETREDFETESDGAIPPSPAKNESSRERLSPLKRYESFDRGDIRSAPTQDKEQDEIPPSPSIGD